METFIIPPQEGFDLKYFVYEIFKRRSGYFFGNSVESNHQVNFLCNADCDDCPYQSFKDSKKPDLTRYIKCYFRNSAEFHNFLMQNGYIVATPLFRIQKLNSDNKIEYSGGYWYPFRTNESFVDPLLQKTYYDQLIQTNLQNDNDNTEAEHLAKLRWDITQKRNTVIEESISFDLFEKVEKSVYAKDKELKYLDVCDGYATFQMMYFVISRRFLSCRSLDDFYQKVLWEISNENEYLRTYIANNPHGKLRITINGLKVYRSSTWKEDLELLGLIDDKGVKTKKFDLFKKWLEKSNEYSDNNITQYKSLLFQAIDFNGSDVRLKMSIEFDDEIKKKFTLTPEIHLFVRAYWITPVRWFFLPMGTDHDNLNDKIISTSGVILVLTDDQLDTAYDPNISSDDSNIVRKVKSILPILYAIHNIENKSFEDYINRERIRIAADQKRYATSAAISQVMARNTSHNIGAHVMNKLIGNLKGTSILKFDTDKGNYYSPLDLKELHSQTILNLENNGWYKNILDEEVKALLLRNEILFEQVSVFNNYVKCRMDYLGDITFGTPSMQTNRYAYADLYKELDKVRLLLENISGLSQFKYEIIFTKNGNALNTNNDILVALPNDILGMQAFYNILENIIRNTAKHSIKKPDIVVFTVNFIDHADTISTLEQKNILNDLIAVEVYDNVHIEHYSGISRVVSEVEKMEYEIATNKKLLAEIDWIVYKQNRKINSDILEENRLRTNSLGVIEMDASAAYLRKRDVSYINHKIYNLEYDESWSAKSILSENDNTKRGTNCRNFLKAFKKNNVLSLYSGVVKTAPTLGYRFFLLRPQVVLIVTEEKVQNLDMLKKQGILVINKRNFEKYLNTGNVYSHDFVLHSNIEDQFLQMHKTSLPVRILRVESDVCVGIFQQCNLENDYRKWLSIFEEFCWRTWGEQVLNLEFEFESFYPKRVGKISSNCDHNKEKIYELGIKSGRYFYYDALSFQGQNKLPKFNGKLSVYASTYAEDICVKTKVGESIYSRLLVIDERIQENAKEEYLGIPISLLYKMTGVIVPKIENLDLSAQSIDKDAILQEISNYVQFDVEKFSNESLSPIAVSIKSELNPYFDFILLHYSILERIFGSDKKQINHFLVALSFHINVVVTSGRGEPDELPMQVRFINLSTVLHALVETRSKYFTNYILHTSRKSSKSKK